MMAHMDSPKKANPVRQSMVNIKNQIYQYKSQQPHDPKRNHGCNIKKFELIQIDMEG